MLWLWPSGLEDRAPFRGWWATLSLVVVLVLVRLLESSLLLLPDWLYPIAEGIARLRLYSDPEAGLFGPWQVWSYMLINDSWFALVIQSLAWVFPALVVERRVGGVVLLVLVVLLAPIGAAGHVLAGHAIPAIGLAPVILGMAGAAFALAPHAMLRVSLWWWALVAVGRLRLLVSLGLFTAIFLFIELVRLTTLPVGAGQHGVQTAFFPVHAATLLFAFAAGFLLARLLIGVAPGRVDGDRLGALVAGGDLAELPAVLAEQAELPLPQLEQLAERCIAEDDREVAAVLYEYLCVRAPECRATGLLRHWLG